ncbi:MAG: hypothetical protein H7235_00970 [Bdellovibrionaceae bacterium]|nr:hypothetical protein [Pseudobdellovibrionaceae bacterium]
MKSIPIKSLVLFFVFFIAGISIVYKYSDQIFIDREIASINTSKLNNIKFLDQESLKQELNKKIKIYTMLAEKEKVIALEGFSSQICKTFPKVELLFDAYGVSVSGEPTQFKISADCIPAQDPADIASIKIPYGKLLNEKPRNAEFKFSGYQASFQFINSDNEVIKTWILNKIVFKSNTESKIVQIDRSQNQQPIVMEF